MKKYMDKLSRLFNLRKKTLIFFIGLLIAGIISGCIFNILLIKQDNELVNTYLTNFIELIKNNKIIHLDTFKNSITFNYLYIIVIWLLGVSIIGIPIIFFMFFGKSFTLGFTLSAIIKKYGIKGCLLSLGYVFPHYILNILVFLVIMAYSTALSLKLIKCIIKRKTIDFKPIMKKYSIILLISLTTILLTSLYEAFIMPIIIKNIIKII